jgi:hypothetical protein
VDVKVTWAPAMPSPPASVTVAVAVVVERPSAMMVDGVS